MAKMSVAGLEMAAGQLEKMGRAGIRRIVEAGSQAAALAMRNAIRTAGHVRNGDLMSSVAPGKLYEELNAATQIVRPQGMTPKGDISEEDIAWILDNDPVRGDKFLRRAWDDIQKAGEDAMAAEADRVLAEIE